MTSRTSLHGFPAFAELKTHATALSNTSIQQLFDQDSDRAADFVIAAAGLQLDYSRHLLNKNTIAALFKLARQAKLHQRIEGLFNGEHVNNTEDRPALHSLLRSSSANGLDDKFCEVVAVRQRMQDITNRLNEGRHQGYTGVAITDVVNIGIGGSDLGPRLVTEALKPYHGNIRCHYVANVDPADLQEILRGLAPASTLFIICSKSFRTEETLANSLAARDWMLASGASTQALDKHFLAVTTNLQAAAGFGISEANCLPIWDWVGGRYSVWSAIGLSCAIAVGWERFTEFLAGAETMDLHFRSSAPEANLPLLMGLLELWYCNFHGAGNHVVLPYDHSLRQLPDFLQQLTMESNGKQVDTDGLPLDYNSAPVLWGSAGTMGQHSFHQLLHQGTLLCPVDFILPLTTHTGMAEQHRMLVANCLAQSRALMVGRSLEACHSSLLKRDMDDKAATQLAPHLTMPGSRPSSIITMKALSPATLGALLALYEHRTFCSSQLWGINPFDQWGVELGKEIGTEILARLTSDEPDHSMDAATDRLIKAWQQAQH